MKIICISDTHVGHDYIPIPEGDVLVHAGDFSSMGREEEVRSFTRWLRSLPHKHKLVIAGNHDVTFERSADEARAWLGDSCTYLENSGVTIDGVNFWGSPYHPWFTDVWAFGVKDPKERERIWQAIPEGTDVLITHGPPKGIFDRTAVGLFVGDPELLEAVKRIKPMAHVFGHIHEGGGKMKEIGDTLFLNVANLDVNYRVVRGATILEIQGRSIKKR